MSDIREWLKCKIKVVEATGCWEFQGAKDKAGYGRIRMDGKVRSAPRLYYDAFVVPLKASEKLEHHLGPAKCIGPACCNPMHLRVKMPYKLRTTLKCCPKGHLIDAQNALVEQDGEILRIRCRICSNERNHKRKDESPAE